ncbi:hypothetical protein [uncultured Parabacteroides sp.]|uniref:phage head completion protein n=1 Tax=uncultured Parabacteroides sp. TaxID=512312 RepID=UPI0026DCAC13|nr:hypothetical protein [uncultured Parabacteroides sp.]
MGQDKVNIGKMVERMQLHEPHKTKSLTGEVAKEYVPNQEFVAEIVGESNSGLLTDSSLPGKYYLKFNAPFFSITTEWKIEYKSVLYNIEKISPIGRGEFAEYECTSIKLV